MYVPLSRLFQTLQHTCSVILDPKKVKFKQYLSGLTCQQLEMFRFCGTVIIKLECYVLNQKHQLLM